MQRLREWEMAWSVSTAKPQSAALKLIRLGIQCPGERLQSVTQFG